MGYYEDSFDYGQLVEGLLDPLGPDGNRLYRTQVFDYLNDSPMRSATMTATDDAVLLFDGVFLLRPELSGMWDLGIFLSIAFDEIVRRARGRDADVFGSAAEAEARYRARYVPAQRHYLRSVQPQDIADIVIANNDPNRPVLVRG